MPYAGTAFTTKRAKPNESPVALAARERLEAAATQSEYLKPIIPAYGGADVVSPPTVLQRDIESMNTVRVHYPKGGYDSVGVPPDKPVDFEVKAHVEYRDRVHCHHVGGPPLPKDAWRVCLSDGTRINRRLTFEDLCPERGALDVYLSSEQSGGSETASEDEFVDSDSEAADDGPAAGRSTGTGGEAQPASGGSKTASDEDDFTDSDSQAAAGGTAAGRSTVTGGEASPAAAVQEFARCLASHIASVQNASVENVPVILEKILNILLRGQTSDDVLSKLRQAEKQVQLEKSAGMGSSSNNQPPSISPSLSLGSDGGGNNQHQVDPAPPPPSSASGVQANASTVIGRSGNDQDQVNNSRHVSEPHVSSDGEQWDGSPSSASSVSSSDECAKCNDGGFLIRCDVCEQYQCFKCAGVVWPPDVSFLCSLCKGNADDLGPDEGTSTFECCICHEDRTLDAQVSLDVCTHNEHMCSTCVFQEMSINSKCPLCRKPVAQVQQCTTGRVYFVRETRRGAGEMAGLQIETDHSEQPEGDDESESEGENSQATTSQHRRERGSFSSRVRTGGQVVQQPARPLPRLDQLKWKLDGDSEFSSVAISQDVYDAAVAARTLIVRTPEEAQRFEGALKETNGSIKGAETRAGKGQPIPWHETMYTADKLERDGFTRIATPTIVCIQREPADDVHSPWYEVQSVFAPSDALTSEALSLAATALSAAADTRFKTLVYGDGRPISKRKGPKSVRGEQVISERGGKAMEGCMLMYGSHRRRSAGAAEEVEGCAREWVARYNPSGKVAALAEVEEHSRALTQLETALLPEAAEARRNRAQTDDPDAAFRVLEGDTESTGFSLSLTSGYVVAPHDDSGLALEAIGFVYPSKTPLPEGHAWEFAVAGCIHPLPTKPGDFVFVAVRGCGVAHGTLPTSSTDWHCANHPGVGSALVSKSDLIRVLQKQQEPGALPAPTQEQLAARRKEVKDAKEVEAGTDEAAGAEASGGARTWKERMLVQIANGELPTTEPTNAPKSVQKALQAFTAERGEGCIILATTPETYAALGVPDVNSRKDAGWMLHELMRRVSEEEKEVKLNLYPSGGGSTKYAWFILSPKGRTELATAAHATTVADLDSAVRSRSTETIRRQAMEQLTAQGLHECPECFGPVLDPNDVQYAEKDALIQRIGKRGTVLECCKCNSASCISG